MKNTFMATKSGKTFLNIIWTCQFDSSKLGYHPNANIKRFYEIKQLKKYKKNFQT